MGLSNMNSLGSPITEKAKVKRSCDGEFHINGGCLASRELAEQYVRKILFVEATDGNITLLRKESDYE